MTAEAEPASLCASDLYFTVILIETFLLPDFTVITVFPFFFAVTTPLLLTVATFLLDDL